MKKKFLLLLFTMTISLVSTVLWTTPAIAAFQDISGQWWEQPIVECNAADIVSGRSTTIFAPKDSVNRLEAVVMLNRALGHRSEADTYNMAEGGYNFPSNFPEWGKKNIAFAADKGYISKSGIPTMDPKHPASRAEIAVLFANALKLSADGYELNFTDNAAIADSLKPFVAAAVKHGIMVGKTGNKFDPNANVTRGEMAVIIARLFENGKISPQPDKYFIAKLSSINTTNKSFTAVKGGQTVTYSLAGDAVYYRDGKKSSLSSFKANENVKVALGSDNKVKFLAYTTAAVSGNTNTVTPDPVPVTPPTTVTGSQIKGYVVNVYLDYVTIHYDDDTSQQIDTTRFSSSLMGFARGQRVALTKSGGVVTEITPLNETRKVFGDVVSIDSSSITYKDDDRYERTLDFASNCKIKDRDGDTISYKDVEEDDTVEMELTDQGKVQSVRLKKATSASVSNREGEVTYIKTSGSYRITIKLSDGDEKTYDVDEDVEVYKGSSSKKRDFEDDLSKQDYVKVKLNSRDEVTRIDILDVEVVEGEVTALDTYDLTIRVKDSRDKSKTYDVISKVSVLEDSKSRSFRYISKGDDVRLLLNEDGEVFLINILTGSSSNKDGTYSGVITDLDIDDEKITLEKSGKKTSYNLEEDVTVRGNNNGNSLEKIIIGSEADLRIEDSLVTRITITEQEDITIEGKLDKINASRIYLIQDNGTRNGVRHLFILDKNVTVKDAKGKSISLSKLNDDYSGETVIVELDGGEADRITVK